MKKEERERSYKDNRGEEKLQPKSKANLPCPSLLLLFFFSASRFSRSFAKMSFTLPPLPFERRALQPFTSEECLKLVACFFLFFLFRYCFFGSFSALFLSFSLFLLILLLVLILFGFPFCGVSVWHFDPQVKFLMPSMRHSAPSRSAWNSSRRQLWVISEAAGRGSCSNKMASLR